MRNFLLRVRNFFKEFINEILDDNNNHKKIVKLDTHRTSYMSDKSIRSKINEKMGLGKQLKKLSEVSLKEVSSELDTIEDLNINNQIEMEKAILFINSKIDLIEKNIGLKNKCRKNCCYCCYQPTFINDYDISLFFNLVTNLNKVRKKNLLSKTEKICAKIDTLELFDFNRGGRKIETMDDADTFAKLVERDSNIYFDNKIPCPFLEDNKCMIYNIRPAVCWAYRMYDSADLCKSKHNPDGGFLFSDWINFYEMRIKLFRPVSNKQNVLTTRLLPHALYSMLAPNKYKRTGLYSLRNPDKLF